MESVCMFSLSLCGFPSGAFAFLPQSKNMQFWSTGYSEMPTGVRVKGCLIDYRPAHAEPLAHSHL